MIKYLKSLFNTKGSKEVIKVVQVEVLSRTALERLRSKLEPPIISSTDSSESAAYRLGIQRVLSMIERDFTS